MTCTFQQFPDTKVPLMWKKGITVPTKVIYVYQQIVHAGRAISEYVNRCVGRMNSDKSVHTLYINSTTVGDEDTYHCQIGFGQGSADLTVNGEYSNNN